MPSFLEKIITYKKKDIVRYQKELPLKELKRIVLDLPPTQDLKRALLQDKRRRKNTVKIIAEIKRASPSKGIIRKDFDPLRIAQIFEENGASAISVLTEEHFFLGSLQDLKSIRKVTRLPLLCKDFIVDPYQIYQARYYGADAILLIAGLLSLEKLRSFTLLAKDLFLTPLIEVHNLRELKKTLKILPEIIGINNRDLKTFKTNLYTTIRLLPLIPEDILVISESGFEKREDLLLFQGKPIAAFLIGEALMREKNIAKKLQELLSS